MVVVGSAPAFPHGVIDPIEELSGLAQRRKVGFHTDACLGGFLLPWARELGYPVPAFDFRLPGVTSMSADTHKYGYAAKGTSVVLYREPSLEAAPVLHRHRLAGRAVPVADLRGQPPRSAQRLVLGGHGLDRARRLPRSQPADPRDRRRIREGIAAIEGLRVLGDPLWVIAFASDELDIYRVMDFMTKRHWNLNGLHRPACVHLCVTLRHTQPGVADRFVADLAGAAAETLPLPARPTRPGAWRRSTGWPPPFPPDVQSATCSAGTSTRSTRWTRVSSENRRTTPKPGPAGQLPGRVPMFVVDLDPTGSTCRR